MSHAPTFHDLVLAHVGQRLAQRGYQFREDVPQHDPEETGHVWYLAFSKDLPEIGYGHVVLYHSPMPAEATQRFDVLIMRSLSREPYDMYARQRARGHPRTQLVGYLPRPTDAPLPLVYHWQMDPIRWIFDTEPTLIQQLRLVWQRLDNPVLPWIECPASSQFVRVEKSWYREPFAAYATGVWDASTAYAAIVPFEAPGFLTEAEDDAASALVYQVTTVLREHHLFPEEGPPARAAIDYLAACLEGTVVYDHNVYAQRLTQR
jgi:hypothetical protein